MIGSLGLTASLLAIGASMQIKIAAGTPGVTAASIGVFAGIVGYMAFHALSYGPCAARRRAPTARHGHPLPAPRPGTCRAGPRSQDHVTPLTPPHRITWLVLAEIFPSNIRGKAMGIATMVNRGTSFVVAYTFLTMCDRSWSGTFYLYAAFAAASFFFYGLFVPETAGVRLEEIAPLFGDPKALVRRNLGSLRAMVGRSKC